MGAIKLKVQGGGGSMPMQVHGAINAPVKSVNGQIGAVVLGAQDVGAYEKPATGIPKTDLASDVQTSLGKADTALQSAPVTSVNGQAGAVVLDAQDVGAYEKPATGIPASDLASGVIPTVPVQDVQVNGTSVLSNGVANVPQGSGTLRGVFMLARDGEIKEGVSSARVISPGEQHTSTFYGLAKAAGDTTQSSSSNTVGNYTDNAKDKIQQMLGIIDMIAPHEGAQAANAYSVGGAFCYSGKLYKATASIAIGDAIVPGTNCTQTTLIELIGGI